MLQGFLPIIIAFVIAMGMGIVMLILSRLVGRQHPVPTKSLPYECGMLPVGDARSRFAIQFYIIAMLFILFDIEGVFFWPWATVYKQLVQSDKLFALGEMGVFVGILLLGFVYLLKRGAFDWE